MQCVSSLTLASAGLKIFSLPRGEVPPREAISLVCGPHFELEFASVALATPRNPTVKTANGVPPVV